MIRVTRGRSRREARPLVNLLLHTRIMASHRGLSDTKMSRCFSAEFRLVDCDQRDLGSRSDGSSRTIVNSYNNE